MTRKELTKWLLAPGAAALLVNTAVWAGPAGDESPSADHDAPKTQKVTGTHLKREVEMVGKQYNTAQPVTVITREQIDGSGLTNIRDVLQKHPIVR